MTVPPPTGIYTPNSPEDQQIIRMKSDAYQSQQQQVQPQTPDSRDVPIGTQAPAIQKPEGGPSLSNKPMLQPQAPAPAKQDAQQQKKQ